ncbi:MAG: hypothetical protein ACYCQL_03895, partial [Acidithiobacillus sp.]
MNFLQRLRQRLWLGARIEIGQFFFVGPGELADFINSRSHFPLFSRYRARFILSRVQMTAAIFAVLTPLWMVVDFATFPLRTAVTLAGARILTSAAFGLLAFL